MKKHFLIGDLHTSALVSNKASIDWLCLPHFDSESIFTKLLDKKAGSFSVEAKGYNTKAAYIKNTAIVNTIFEKKGASFEVKDFMVPQPRSRCDCHLLVRKLHALSGKHTIKFVYEPKINYGKNAPKLTLKGNTIVSKLNKSKMVLHLPKSAKVLIEENKCNIEVTVQKNETVEIILENCTGKMHFQNKDLEKRTRDFWKEWVAKGTFFSFCKERLIRSAITLKLMQFYPTGGLIAAPTTSIPEAIGGKRNWDYRYVWIRDATFTLYAFYVLGYTEEAKKFFTFIEKIAYNIDKKDIDLKLIYTIDGKKPPKERSLKYLSGYKDSKPVRVGNDAMNQFQLDVYGTLIDSYYFMWKKGFKISKEKRAIILNLLRKIKQFWKKPDSGMWEFRKDIRQYTSSKVIAWVGVNRALRMADQINLGKKEKEELECLEKEIRKWIIDHCYDPKTNTLMMYPKSKCQDSTNFLFVLLQFLDKSDPATKAIVENTRKELASNAFIYRYKKKDDFKSKEGSFALCSFWLISALAILEKVEKAENMFKQFEKALGTNGLISEEIDPKTKAYLGNYPQAFSHMGYIMASYYLDRYDKKQKKMKKVRKKKL